MPTFHHSRQKPETATRQLDFVFASKALSDRVKVRALNTPAEWGPSDHCRLVIDVEPEDAFGNPAQEPGPDSNAKSTDRTVSRCESATGPTAEMTRVGRF